MTRLVPIVTVAALCTASSLAYGADPICAPGYARSQRLPPAEYYPLAQRVFARDGVPWSDRHNWTLDHVTPLCAGGTNAEANLQLQRPADAKIKDRLEWEACRRICNGRVSLTEAQGWFKNWQAAYRVVFGEAP